MTEKIKTECPRIVWKESFATLGRFDVVDIAQAADPKEVEKAVMIIRAYGHSINRNPSCHALEGIP